MKLMRIGGQPWSLLTCLFAMWGSLGCSDETGGSKDSPGAAGTAPQGGYSSNSSGGGAGINPGGTPSGGSSGGSASGGGASSVEEVFDPSLPKPTYDCRTDVTNKTCLSVSGNVGGSFDRHCALPSSPDLLLRNPDAWPVACFEDSSTAKVGYFFQVAVPVQGAGPFTFMVAPGGKFTGADVVAAKDDAGGDFRSDHLVSGAIAATVEVDSGATTNIITGTFRAQWGEPEVDCDSRIPNTCLAGKVHGTFRVEHYLKP